MNSPARAAATAQPNPPAPISSRARRRDQAARAAARAGGIASLAVVLLGAPILHHNAERATTSTYAASPNHSSGLADGERS